MNSDELAKYIENIDGISKPWLLIQLRLKKLEERRDTLADSKYIATLAEIHQDMMNLGEWWLGREDEVFG